MDAWIIEFRRLSSISFFNCNVCIFLKTKFASVKIPRALARSAVKTVCFCFVVWFTFSDSLNHLLISFVKQINLCRFLCKIILPCSHCISTQGKPMLQVFYLLIVTLSDWLSIWCYCLNNVSHPADVTNPLSE